MQFIQKIFFKAIERQWPRVVKIALWFGADINTKNEQGLLPIEVADAKWNLSIMTSLLTAHVQKNPEFKLESLKGLKVRLYEPWIHLSAYNGIEQVQKLADTKLMLNYRSYGTGETLLHKTARCPDNERIIKRLIELGIPVNEADYHGRTPLHYAVFTDNNPNIQILIDNKANLEAKDQQYYTLLHYAAESKYGYQNAKSLIKNGADVNAETKTGITPLHLAAYRANIKTMSYLMENGANVKAASFYGITPMHYAVDSGNVEAMKLLVRAGAKVNIKDKDGDNSLHKAAWRNVKMVEYCLANVCKVNELGRDNRTPLHNAVFNGNVTNIMYLIEKGADVKAKDNDGNTPLHSLVSDRFSARGISAIDIIKIAHAFIRQGADVNAKNEDGKTPLHLLMNRTTEVVMIMDVLIQAGAKVGAKDNKSNTPMHIAASHASTRAIKRLLDERALLNIRNNQGKTPLDMVEGNDSRLKQAATILITEHGGKHGKDLPILKENNTSPNWAAGARQRNANKEKVMEMN
jgi:ankyrin repeat protein